MGGKKPWGATSLHPGGEEAGGRRSAGAGCRARGRGQGTADPSLKRDANRQSWEKVNKGHAPCRRPAGAHPPLRPPPVHFHSPSASPQLDSRAASEVEAAPDPSPHPWRRGSAPSTLTCKGCPPPLQKKLSNLCRASNPRSRACCPRVQHPRAPGRERGLQGGGGGPRKVSGTGPAAREPSARSCAPAQPGSAPGRAAYQQNETRGDRRADSSRFSEPPPRPLDLPTVPISRRSPYARPEPAGQVAALTRPRPPAPPRRPGGALPQSLIKKVAKLTLPKVVVACAPLSLPALYSLKHD
nr:serine/arginine repetitive matrix protein 1-like isoform X1 [Chlorocebus sabaeus]XP_037863723.1 serine/arginine repetitive matrix protein 1-like isoform X1 [Chlorocebus sabaeus]